jgi:uncharacterized protein YpmS
MQDEFNAPCLFRRFVVLIGIMNIFIASTAEATNLLIFQYSSWKMQLYISRHVRGELKTKMTPSYKICITFQNVSWTTWHGRKRVLDERIKISVYFLPYHWQN